MSKIEELVRGVEQQHGVNVLSSKREAFIKMLNRDAQSTGDGQTWRTSTGRKIADINEYILSRMESGNFVSVKPSVKNEYQPKFKIRDDVAKSKHQALVAGHVQKLFEQARLKFKPGAEAKAIDLISKNFLISDDADGNPVFQKINDTAIGSIPGKDKYNFDKLLSTLGINLWTDDLATRIAQAQHKASLRQTAKTLSETGDKLDVERLMKDLDSFERRALRTGFKPMPFQESAFNDELTNFHKLNDPAMATTRARQELSALSSLNDLLFEVRKTEFPIEETKDYEF